MRALGWFSAMIMAHLLFAWSPGRVLAADDMNFDRRTPVVRVYESTHKAVVNIAGERIVSTSGWSGFAWPDMFDPWGPRYRRQVTVLGSGVLVHEDGYIITNAHVIRSAEKITVVFSDGREFPAELVSQDEARDLAVLTISAEEKLPYIRLGQSDDLMIGETVVAIGNPYGYANTVTSGVISALGRDIQVTEGSWLRGLIQTDASINPGNSGGPLLNINGRLIGVNTAVRAEAENIGFAIPVDTLADNLSQMLMPENLRRVRLGLSVGRMKTVGEFTGLIVDSVSKDSPADDQGIAPGDIILEIDGKKLSGVIDFYVKLMPKKIGEPIALKFVRPGSPKPRSRTVNLKLLARPLPDGRLLVSRLMQMDVSELTDSVADKFGFEGAYPILIVTGLDRDGAAAKAGLAPGDLILQINGSAVGNTKELSLEMEKISEGDLVTLRMMRISAGTFGQVQRQFIVRIKAATKKPATRLLGMGTP